MRRKKWAVVLIVLCCALISGGRHRHISLRHILHQEQAATARVNKMTPRLQSQESLKTIESAVALLTDFHAINQRVATDLQLTPLQELFRPGQPMALLTRPGKNWNMEPLMPAPLPPTANPASLSPERFNFGPLDLAASPATGSSHQPDTSVASGASGSPAIIPAPRVVMFPSVGPAMPEETGEIGSIGEQISETSPTVVPLPAPLAMGAVGLVLAALARRRFAQWV